MEKATIWTLFVIIGIAAERLYAQNKSDSKRLFSNIGFGLGAVLSAAATIFILQNIFLFLGGIYSIIDLREYDHPAIAILLGMVLLVFGDLIYYAWHRAQHKYPILWEIHKVHHGDSDFDITTYIRQHWLEGPIQITIITVPLGLLVRMPDAAYMITILTGSILAFWSHFSMPIHLGPATRIVIGPELHRTHHYSDRSWSGSNYAGATPIWDVLFGTYRDPRSIEKNPDIEVSKMIIEPRREKS